MKRLSLLLALTFAASALGQTYAIEARDPARGINLPPTGAALIDEATSPNINPAGLAFVEGFQLEYLHDRNVGLNEVSDGLFLAARLGGMRLGFGEEWIRPSLLPHYRRTSWTLAAGDQWLSLGAGLHLYSSDDHGLDAQTSVDLGLSSRPARWLSLGFAVQNVNEPSNGAYHFDRHYDLGVGVRPLGERFTVGADYLIPETGGFDEGVLQGTLHFQVLPGLHLGAGISHGLAANQQFRFQLGLTVDAQHLGLTYAGGGAPGGADHLIAVRASAAAFEPLSLANGKIVLLDLDDLLAPQGGVGALLGLRSDDPYLRLQRILDRIARDEDVSGVILKVNGLAGGLGKAEELREAIVRVRTAGKRVISVLLSADDPTYLMASASDRIETVHQAMLDIDGLSSTTTFLGGTMDKLGVHWDVARVGAYKNAPDQLTQTQMSKAQRESLTAFLDTASRQFETAVRGGRKLPGDVIATALRQGLIPPKQALALHLVDDVIDPAQLGEQVERLIPGADYDPGYLSDPQRTTRWGPRPVIAIVPVLGDITGGESAQSPVGPKVAGAQTVVLALRRAAADPSVAAIVLRVDSPGGDGLASDLIYREVLEAKKRKPVVASMGDLAASGGYYAATGADEIFALPTTLTGSIGVFVVKPSLGGLGEKLGIHAETIQRGPMAGLFNLWRPWTPEEQKTAQAWSDAFYDDFITAVSDSRHLPKDQVDQVARGRIWSGEDALQRHLVDRMGGLLDAVDAARERAHLSRTADVKLVEYGAPHGVFGSMGGAPKVLAGWLGMDASPQLPEGLTALVQSLGLDARALTHAGLEARLPFNVQVR